MAPAIVLEICLEGIAPRWWCNPKPKLDASFREHFSALHRAASAGEFTDGRTTPTSSATEINRLDRFTRDINRSEANPFYSDIQTLRLVSEAIDSSFGRALRTLRRVFMYMPFYV